MRILSIVCVLTFISFAFGFCGAQWKARAYSPEGRDDWQQPERVIAELDLRPGQSVADVGAGGGYFTFRLARAVGPEGVVYAVDLDPEMLELIRSEAWERGATRVLTGAGEADDPRIAAPVDLVFIVNTYHHIEDPTAYFRKVQTYLKPGGRVAVIDFHPEGFFHNFLGHGAQAEDVSESLARAGFRLLIRHDFLERQHFQIFTVQD